MTSSSAVAEIARRFLSLDISESIKVTQSHSKWHPWVCKSLLLFHWNYVSRSVFEIFSIK